MALMAALEAVQELQTQGKLVVTRIAGASAGAIAGCLFAAGIPMDKVRRELQGEEGQKLIRAFRWSTPAAVGRLLRGRAIWDVEPLRVFLQKMLEGSGVSTLDEIRKKTGIETMVVVTDLGRLGMVPSPGRSGIVDAVLDSAGLPFFFRVWNRNNANTLVDGGICENLPLLNLKSDAASGQVVAISFRSEETTHPRSLFEFARSLLDAAINNSVDRAKESLPDAQVLSINSNIGLIDFAKAFTTGVGDAYDLQQKNTTTYLESLIASQEHKPIPRQPTPWESADALSIDLMQKLGAVYENIAHTKFHYRSCTLVATVYSLLDDKMPLTRPDLFTYNLEFEPATEPLQGFSVGRTQSPELYLDRTTWAFHDESENPLEAVSFPIKPKNPSGGIELLYLFKKSLNSGRYTAQFIDESLKFFPGLLTPERRDDMIFNPRQAIGPTGRVNLIIKVPDNELGRKARLSPMSFNSNPGREMKPKEMQKEIFPGFRLLGWTGENVEGRFGVDILL